MNSIADPRVARQMVRGAMALRASDPERALQLFDELLRADPHNSVVLRNKGRLLLKQRQQDQAEPVWATLAKVLPRDAEAHFQLARLRARAGSLEPAIEGADRALELAPPPDLARRIEREREGWTQRLQRMQALARGERLGFRPPPVDVAMRQVYQAAAKKSDLLALLSSIEALIDAGASAADTQDILRLQLPRLLDLFRREGAEQDPGQIADVVDRINFLARADAATLLRLAILADAHLPPGAQLARMRRCSALPLAETVADAPRLLAEAARISLAAGDERIAVAYARSALVAVARKPDPAILRYATQATRLLTARGHAAECVTFWQSIDTAPGARPVIEQRAGLGAALDALARHPELLEVAGRTLIDAAPVDTLAPRDCNLLVGLVRRGVQSAQAARLRARIPALEQAMLDATPEDARGQVFHWALSGLSLAKFDQKAAFAHLERGLTCAPLQPKVTLDLHCEQALIYRRYHLFGEANDLIGTLPPVMMAPGSFYFKRLDFVREIAEFCPDAAQPLRFPECLFDVVLDEMNGRPIGYEPVPRHLLMVSGSLGQGGGERQTLTMVRRILREPRVNKLSLMVRSTHLRPSDDFFWPEVSKLPLDLKVYGLEWERRTDIAEYLPELADRPRVAAAISLMPHNLREEIIRLCREFLDRRPAAVHIWQDVFCAAVACVITGVPYFFIHRGSLSPDYWEHNDYQAAVFFRVMQHAYRRLLESPAFIIGNNSLPGCNTDQNWTRWPDATPFQIIYNAVDFTQLGAHVGRNDALRAELGIPPDSFVVGGSFRITPVKRPHIWIAACGIIARAFPTAHFLIIGDGELTDAARAQAEELGFSERLHLPGRVSNVGDWYRAMDLKLLTSEREGIPNAIIEAQHYGCPIVATDVGGIAEAIEPGFSGFVIPGPPGGAPPEPYAAKVIEIFSDKEWFDRARRRAQDYVHSRFSLDNLVNQLLGFYGFEARMALADTHMPPRDAAEAVPEAASEPKPEPVKAGKPAKAKRRAAKPKAPKTETLPAETLPAETPQPAPEAAPPVDPRRYANAAPSTRKQRTQVFTMTDDELFDAIVDAVREETEQHELVLRRNMTADQVEGWDSLAHVRIMLNIEVRTGAPIEISDTYRAATIGDLIPILRKALAKTGAKAR